MNISMIKKSTLNLLNRKLTYECFTVIMRDINKALKIKEEIDFKTLLSKEQSDFADLFSRKLADILSSHHLKNHTISLTDGHKSSFCALQGMSQDELWILKKFFEEHVKKDFIQISSWSVVVWVLFAKKSKGELKLCVDYQALNNIRVDNWY